MIKKALDFDIIPANFEDAKENLVLKLDNVHNIFVSKDDLQSKLRPLPLAYIADDLVLTCQLDFPAEDKNYIASVKINEDLLKLWGIDQSALLDAAIRNCNDKMPYTFNRLEDYLPLQEEDANGMLWILSNTKTRYGASVVAYYGLLEHIANDCFDHEDLYLIPSSVHEFIVIPASIAEDLSLNELHGVESINDTINSVNSTAVMDKDVLSDHLYKYSCHELEHRTFLLESIR